MELELNGGQFGVLFVSAGAHECVGLRRALRASAANVIFGAESEIIVVASIPCAYVRTFKRHGFVLAPY